MKNPVYVITRRGTIKAETREVDFVLSTAIEDRAGDIVSVDGWKVDNYRKNPVVLWAHDHEIPAIGACSNVRVEAGALVGTVKFATVEQHPFADTVFKLIQGGFINAGSVGFLPIDWKIEDEKLVFLEHELLEFSICNVPMNAQALSRAAGSGIDVAPLASALAAKSKARTYADVRKTLFDDDAARRQSVANMARLRNRATALRTKLRTVE